MKLKPIMEYSLKEHGDSLEKAAADFVMQNFPYYEAVWKIYIGNNGYDVMAELPNYPDEKKRKDFAENSYTVLESVFLLDDIIKSGIFIETPNTFRNYLELNKAFITAFALIGRVRDTVIKASEILKYDNSDFIQSLKKFYEARSIVMHGKKVPLKFDDDGLLKVPFLKTHVIEGYAWDDKNSNWNDIDEMQVEYIEDKLSGFFYQIIHLINNEYARFYDVILNELKGLNTEIIFKHESERKVAADYPSASGTVAASVYGYIDPHKNSHIKRPETAVVQIIHPRSD